MVTRRRLRVAWHSCNYQAFSATCGSCHCLAGRRTRRLEHCRVQIPRLIPLRGRNSTNCWNRLPVCSCWIQISPPICCSVKLPGLKSGGKHQTVAENSTGYRRKKKCRICPSLCVGLLEKTRMKTGRKHTAPGPNRLPEVWALTRAMSRPVWTGGIGSSWNRTKQRRSSRLRSRISSGRLHLCQRCDEVERSLLEHLKKTKSNTSISTSRWKQKKKKSPYTLAYFSFVLNIFCGFCWTGRHSRKKLVQQIGHEYFLHVSCWFSRQQWSNVSAYTQAAYISQKPIAREDQNLQPPTDKLHDAIWKGHTENWKDHTENGVEKCSMQNSAKAKRKKSLHVYVKVRSGRKGPGNESKVNIHLRNEEPPLTSAFTTLMLFAQTGCSSVDIFVRPATMVTSISGCKCPWNLFSFPSNLFLKLTLITLCDQLIFLRLGPRIVSGKINHDYTSFEQLL